MYLALETSSGVIYFQIWEIGSKVATGKGVESLGNYKHDTGFSEGGKLAPFSPKIPKTFA